MMRFSACIEMMFKELSFIERISRAKEYSFNAIEFWHQEDKDLNLLKSRCLENNVEISLFIGLESQLTETFKKKEIKRKFYESLEAAEFLGCGMLLLHINSFSSTEIQKIPELSSEIRKEKKNFIIEAVNEIVSIVKYSDVKICLEPVNNIDFPGYFLNHASEALEIIKKINSTKLKMLFDIYHMEIMGENILQVLEENIDLIGYIHVADAPGRHEPGTGKINFDSIYKKLLMLDYKGYVGFEYIPAATTESSLDPVKKIFCF
jgi:hydroxypyruvate isomerase